MAVILGIDIGTSGTKGMLFDTEKGPVGVLNADYGVDIPHTGYAEQPADRWWNAAVSVLQGLREKYSSAFEAVAAVGFSGQMHGLACLDSKGVPLRPAIIWLDQRSSAQLDEIYEKVGYEKLRDIAHNRVFTGFGLPSLMWMKENEPELFDSTGAVVSAKDYVRFRLTGNIGAESSDASSTVCFNVRERDWAWDIIDACGLPRRIFSRCGEATDIAGYVTASAAGETGLRHGIPVVYGSGDVAAYLLGTGVVKEKTVVSNIGTGGQLSVCSYEDVYDPQMRIHSFCNCINRSNVIFGGHLCSGISLKWLKNQVLCLGGFDEMTSLASEVSPGSGGLLYLPYLTGCRSPEMDPGAKGIFFGLQLDQDRRHFIRSVMEGVIFDFRKTQDIFEEMGIRSEKVIACGGGAKSPLWLQIQADILGHDVQVCTEKEQACLGACIMAGVGCGLLESAESACRSFIHMEEKTYRPIKQNVDIYNDEYQVYKQLYSSNRHLFAK